MFSWWARLAFQRIVSSLPMTVWLWKRYLRQKYLSTIDEETVQSALHQLELARAHHLPLHGKTVLEIGSGWKPIIPLVLRMAGVEQVVMHDVSETMDLEMLKKAVQQVREKSIAAGPILEKIGLNLENVPSNYPSKFQEALRMFHLEYRIGELDVKDVDGIVSHNVLEHVTEEELPKLLKRCHSLLKPGGWMIHFIDHSDHLQHRHPEISPLHFLRFSEERWKRWSVGPFHQNRLRWYEFEALFRQKGFEILAWEKEWYQGVVDEIKGMELCTRYRSALAEDLAVLKSRVVLKKSSVLPDDSKGM